MTFDRKTDGLIIKGRPKSGALLINCKKSQETEEPCLYSIDDILMKNVSTCITKDPQNFVSNIIAEGKDPNLLYLKCGAGILRSANYGRCLTKRFKSMDENKAFLIFRPISDKRIIIIHMVKTTRKTVLEIKQPVVKKGFHPQNQSFFTTTAW